MDADIRAALRAMRDPEVLESIPTEALLAVAREALKRPEAQGLLDDHIPGALKRLASLPADPALADVEKNVISTLAAMMYRILAERNRTQREESQRIRERERREREERLVREREAAALPAAMPPRQSGRD